MKNETKDRHLRNLKKLRDQNAPAAVIDAYYQAEKISPEDLRIRADESGFGVALTYSFCFIAS